MPKTVTKVAQIPKLQHKKRVAAYARVSSGKDAMLHSLSAQVSFYNDLIQKEDAWEFVGVYSDAPVIIGLKQNPTQTGAALVLFSLFMGIFETFR